MKIKVEFNLPEDDTEYQNFLKSTVHSCLINDTFTKLRGICKYESDGKPSQDMEEFYRWFCEAAHDYQIEL